MNSLTIYITGSNNSCFRTQYLRPQPAAEDGEDVLRRPDRICSVLRRPEPKFDPVLRWKFPSSAIIIHPRLPRPVKIRISPVENRQRFPKFSATRLRCFPTNSYMKTSIQIMVGRQTRSFRIETYISLEITLTHKNGIETLMRCLKIVTQFRWKLTGINFAFVTNLKIIIMHVLIPDSNCHSNFVTLFLDDFRITLMSPFTISQYFSTFPAFVATHRSATPIFCPPSSAAPIENFSSSAVLRRPDKSDSVLRRPSSAALKARGYYGPNH